MSLLTIETIDYDNSDGINYSNWDQPIISTPLLGAPQSGTKTPFHPVALSIPLPAINLVLDPAGPSFNYMNSTSFSSSYNSAYFDSESYYYVTEVGVSPIVYNESFYSPQNLGNI